MHQGKGLNRFGSIGAGSMGKAASKARDLPFREFKNRRGESPPTPPGKITP